VTVARNGSISAFVPIATLAPLEAYVFALTVAR
jgi:hypothetical protein